MQKVFNFFKSSFLRSEEKIFGGLRETYGKKWSVGDIIGVFLDTNDKTIGEWKHIRQFTRHVRMETQMTNYKTILEWQHGRISASRNEANYCCTAHSQPPSGVNSGDRQENHIRTAANTISQICKFGRFRAEFFQVGHLFDISCSMFWPASPNMFHHLTQLDFREYLLKKADISFTGLHQEF